MLFLPKNLDPKNEIESLDKALELLQQRYEKKQITIEEFSKKCNKIAKRKEKLMKKQKKNS